MQRSTNLPDLSPASGLRLPPFQAQRLAALLLDVATTFPPCRRGDGDDRTPVGIHEGISRLACHQGHGEQTRTSCGNCHPKMSNCGLDVEKMDTTFRSRTGRHNIHPFECLDCHIHGVPKRRNAVGEKGD